MLYCKGRQNSQKDIRQIKCKVFSLHLFRIIFFSSLLTAILSSCQETKKNPYQDLTLEYFKELSFNGYEISDERVRHFIKRLENKDSITFSSDRAVRKHYDENKPYIWIDRLGIESKADSLLEILKIATTYGINLKIFRLDEIKKDLESVKTLEFSFEDINLVMARLEYNLTIAYFRFSTIQNFGFVNPDYLYNNLELLTSDTLETRYRQLSDLRVERAGDSYYSTLIRKVKNDSLQTFLKEIQPKGELLDKLLKRLSIEGLSREERLKIICNIERCRWRPKNLRDILEAQKRVIVNIPSYSLRAIEENEEKLSMKVGCGSKETKTPLLTSMIKRMDVNPIWIIPKSIAKTLVGRVNYMRSMGMYVKDSQKGKLPPEAASIEDIISGKQCIIQEGGKKNSLGRIIFRFDNNFSVYLHDTSSPSVFSSDVRAVSHGCVRVEKPYDLAVFMLNEDEDSQDLAQKLKYSMSVDLINYNDTTKESNIDKSKLLHTINVDPEVGLIISYFTLYFDALGQIEEYNDIYNYDEPLINKLKEFSN